MSDAHLDGHQCSPAPWLRIIKKLSRKTARISTVAAGFTDLHFDASALD
jgi:hypothetical protein